MEENQNPSGDALFMMLVMNFQTSAMMGMGKLINPVTQKIERKMEEAKFSIDMLQMLADKTKGNLSDAEDRLVQKSLTDLRLNYVTELDKKDQDEGESDVKSEMDKDPVESNDSQDDKIKSDTSSDKNTD